MQSEKLRGGSLKSSIWASMQLKTTEELEEIWRSNDRTQWSDAAFEAVRETLLERGNALPEQAEPIMAVVRAPGWQDIAMHWLRAHAKAILLSLSVLLVVAVIGSVLFTQACRSSGAPSLSCISAKFWLPSHLWQTDAFMTSFTYYIAGEKTSHVIGEYHSWHTADLLLLEMDESGMVRASTVDQGLYSFSGNQLPITRQDWNIDARQALTIFMQDKQVAACLAAPSSLQFANIYVSKFPFRTASQQPHWTLEIDCPSWLPGFDVDAKTGERINYGQ